MAKARTIEKAMVLCAGLGTRLLPITERYPKPLVPILNIPNLLHIFYLLEKAGIREVVVNLFHLPERIQEFLTDYYDGNLEVSFSKESILLGTGGGVKKAEAFFGKQPFVLANCDFVTNAPIEKVIAKHFENDAIATMLLLDDPVRANLYSKVGIDAKGHLCSLPRKEIAKPVRTGIFTGIHVLSPEIFDYLEERPSGINEILYPALMLDAPDKIFGEFPKNYYWFDTGDLPAFQQSTIALLNLLEDKKSGVREVLNAFGTQYKEAKPRVWLAENVELPEDVKLIPPVLIGNNCLVGSKSIIGPYSILGDNVHVGAGSSLVGTIALAGSLTEPGTKVEDTILYDGQAISMKPKQ